MLFCAWWFYNGPEILNRKGISAATTICSNYITQNPQLANFIAEQRDQFGEFNTAVAIESLDGRTLNPEARRRGIEVRARLTSLYNKDAANDESVLWSHGTAIDAMSELPEATEDYLAQLETARKDNDYWSLVRNDPVALTSKLLRDDKDWRADYRENREWYLAMLEVLMALLEINDEGDSQTGRFIELDDLLRVVVDGKPYLMQLVPAPGETPIEACIYFETFRQFGAAIVMAADEGLSPREVAEVIILNRDALLTNEDEANGQRIAEPAALASRLVELNRNRPDVWKAAQRDGFVLSFDKLTPGLSQSVLEKYADLGTASLIVTQYPELATQAASIVNEYGDLGVAVLVQYDGSDTFRALLRSADVDHRIAMVAVLKSDVGLESALENPAYIDKWIGEDGKPLEDEWWTNVPLVGGIGKVAVNYATGVPSDWSEVGWAAWDVADVGLMALTFGGSKGATEAGKLAAKQTAKRVGKSAAQKLTTTGLKRTGAAVKPTAMARLIGVAKASKVPKPIRWTARTTIQLASVSLTAGSKLVSASRRIIQTAKRIPPGVRRWAARGLLGASLFVRGPERIRALISSLNDVSEKVIGGITDAIPAAINNAIDRLKEEMRNLASGNLTTLTYFLVLASTGLFAALCLFSPSRKFAFAAAGSGSQQSGRTRKSTHSGKTK